MREMAHKISNLESDLKILEAKRSFRVVTLDGEVQSLKAQLTELPNLRARVSEIPSLQAQLGQLQLSLRAAEKREHEQVGTLYSLLCRRLSDLSSNRFYLIQFFSIDVLFYFMF